MPRDMDDTFRRCYRPNSQYLTRDPELRPGLRPEVLRVLHISKLRRRRLRQLTCFAMPVPAAGELWIHHRGRGGVVPGWREQVRRLPGTGWDR